MWTLKSTIRLFVSAWLLCLLLVCGSTAQAETMYQISESELTALETDLNQLQKSNTSKRDLLAEQKTQLETAQKELTESKSQNAATRKSLERANQSLRQFEDEAKRKIRVKTRQRDLWIAISGGLLYAWIKK